MSLELHRRSFRQVAFCLVLSLTSGAALATATIGVREAATALERQLHAGNAGSVREAFRLPLAGSSVVLGGEATLQPLDHGRCRRTLELVHDQPFERKGLRITSLSRRSVQDGPCQNFADAMSAQADSTARSIAEQIGLAATTPDTVSGQRGHQGQQVLVAQAGSAVPKLIESTVPAAGQPVSLTVLQKAIIRDAPNTSGEKLSRAEAGTRLKAQRIAGNADWFMLDGGLRFISASVVDVSDAATAAAPAHGDTSRVRLKVVERAVLRNAPSFTGKKVASLAAGVERLARKVPGMRGWFELTDSASRYPLYIHESVVAQKGADKRA